ncbi:hypothetical protein [Methanolobus profundi]|uniref:Uncharacterized protein n=1 Tax=Methanolobus profundi TaxID=487685 RepID=A0A1I4RZT7_9EURY|nr:hypothetical protein [Methanolobus profundi]SFM57826.1 hypothetical protein SAMN04488696_1686 [Methanolobus profundi]
MSKEKCNEKSSSCGCGCSCGTGMFKVWVLIGVMVGLIWYFVQ